MREKGFNLFTALVAIILVVLAVLLVNTMISSERTIVDMISDIEEEQKMQTIADLAKADALHAFNFGIRYSLEEWLTKDKLPEDGIPDNSYLLSPELAELGFDEIKKDFAKTNFGVCEETAEGRTCQGEQFSIMAAQYLVNLLEHTPDVRNYTIDLDSPQTFELQQLLQKVFDKSTQEEDFFQVINCDGTWENCQNGTFYINLNLKRPEEGGYLNDTEYEKFPQIVVTNRATRRVLKEPILPRGNIQIYVPLRLFKAISGGIEIAKKENGIYTDEFKERLDLLKIGVCGSDCAPTINPFNPFDTYLKADEKACVGARLASAEQRIPEIDFFSNPLFSYDPNETSSMNTNLGLFGEQLFLHPAINQMVQNHVDERDNFGVKEVGVNAAIEVKVLVTPEPSRIVKSFLESETETTAYAYCSKVRGIKATVVFEEKDEKYTVSKTGTGSLNKYAIRFEDEAYSKFTPTTPGFGLPVCRTESKGGLDSTDLTCVLVEG